VDAAAEQDHLERDRATSDSGQPSSYAVVAAGTGDLLGDIAWRLDLPLLGIADVGYATLPEARGRGVASAALGLLTTWLTDPVGGCGLPRVQLDHAVANAASCRVAARAGFVQEGVRRGYLPVVDPDAPAGWSRADVCLHGFVVAG
jgi:RimJ/RimL family protein N-acetyltransferase